MSVNHSILPITESDLRSLLVTPQSIHEFVKRRETDVRRLLTDGLAIIALTAEGEDDPLTFLQSGAPQSVSGWIGEGLPEADMGYGPASYYRNDFVAEVAARLEPWTVAAFSERCDVEWLEQHNVYPGGWRVAGRRERLIRAFAVYRDCVMSTASSGKHLLVWND